MFNTGDAEQQYLIEGILHTLQWKAAMRQAKLSDWKRVLKHAMVEHDSNLEQAAV